MVPAQAVVLDDVTDGKMDLEQLEKAPSEIRQEARAGRPAHYVEIDPVAEKKLLRKIDLCLLPIATLVNLLSFIDRAVGLLRRLVTGALRVRAGLMRYVPTTEHR